MKSKKANGYTLEEISKVTGIPVENIRVPHKQPRKKFRIGFSWGYLFLAVWCVLGAMTEMVWPCGNWMGTAIGGLCWVGVMFNIVATFLPK
ncbi:MAG: hypothetical protein V3U54_08835 [Thermodesulfobacteriota bacterium]